ncbi:cyclophilin [Powellomyces hirtus]|nr:cyclophilin [Powellomyces hirtus]
MAPLPAATPSRAFLDVRIGNPAAQVAEEEAYTRAVAFVKAKCSALGVDTQTAPENLEEWQRDMVSELHEADPIWSAKGKLRLTPPPTPPGGRLVFQLHTKACPKTTLNFTSLCTGASGLSKTTKKPLHFARTPIHRIVKGYIAQGGDITRHDGSGGDSIFSGAFNDEKEGLKTGFAKGRGVLAMANSGKNSNTSQWFVTLTDNADQLKKMEGKYVVFGELVEGFEVLDALNNVGTDSGNPNTPVLVWESGVLP